MDLRGGGIFIVFNCSVFISKLKLKSAHFSYSASGRKLASVFSYHAKRSHCGLWKWNLECNIYANSCAIQWFFCKPLLAFLLLFPCLVPSLLFQPYLPSLFVLFTYYPYSYHPFSNWAVLICISYSQIRKSLQSISKRLNDWLHESSPALAGVAAQRLNDAGGGLHASGLSPSTVWRGEFLSLALASAYLAIQKHILCK